MDLLRTVKSMNDTDDTDWFWALTSILIAYFAPLGPQTKNQKAISGQV